MKDDAEQIAALTDRLSEAEDRLRAVDGMHRPDHKGPILGLRCATCLSNYGGYAVPVSWPCPTFLAAHRRVLGMHEVSQSPDPAGDNDVINWLGEDFVPVARLHEAEARLADVRALADLIDLQTELEPDPAQFRHHKTGAWHEVSDEIRKAANGYTGGQ